MNPNAAEFARRIEHTCLAPEATSERIDQLCDEAVEYGFHGVCVNPIYVRRAAERLARACAGAGDGHAPIVISVAGFPLGACRTETKADEARRAMDDGASEVDMVARIGAILDGDSSAVRRDIEAVAHAVHRAERPGLLKVILETSVLSDERIIMGCRACAEGEADFVKTSTGLHPAGGACVEHVRLLRRHASPIRVKAAGGIRDAAAAMAMIDAGADRIGTSSGVAIMQSLKAIGGTTINGGPDRS